MICDNIFMHFLLFMFAILLGAWYSHGLAIVTNASQEE